MATSPKPVPSFEEAFRVASDTVRFTGAELVQLDQAVGRILAEDVVSDMDMPPFNKSAMDGYACRRGDLGSELRMVETIPAGRPPTRSVGRGECSKIMTGAAVPEGADCVVPVEITRCSDEGAVTITGELTRDNICFQAEDIRAGDIVLHKGTPIAPQHIGVLATVGRARPPVARRPTVGIITTGDEIVEPDATPSPAQIRNSNGHQLSAQVQRAGAIPKYYGIVPDTVEALDTAVKQAIDDCDVILLSGGVSMGDFDLVPGVLKQNGFDLLFEKIAIKPGKPTVFGVHTPTHPHIHDAGGVTRRPTYVFGLPGNPVSTFVIFELLVRPFLWQLMGRDTPATTWQARLAAPIRRRKSGRDAWIPVRINDAGDAEPISYHGSAHLNALTEADGLICLPTGTHKIDEGTSVDVRPI